MSEDAENRSLAQWATEGLQPDPAPPAPEPVAPEPAPEPAADAVVEPVANEPAEPVEAVADPEPAADAPKPKAKPKPLEPWVKDRLAEVTAKQREAERRLAEAEARAQVLEAEAAALRKRQTQPTDPNAPGAPASNVETLPNANRPGYVPESEVEARAAKIASERALNARADQTYFAGKAAHEDFDNAITPLREMGAFVQPEFYQAVFATESPHDVIYHLGSNPNEASRIVGLLKSGDAIKAAVELARIDAQLSGERAAPKPKPGSKAPAPIKPVGGSANPAMPPADKMDDEQFTSELDNLARAKGWY